MAAIDTLYIFPVMFKAWPQNIDKCGVYSTLNIHSPFILLLDCYLQCNPHPGSTFSLKNKTVSPFIVF